MPLLLLAGVVPAAWPGGRARRRSGRMLIGFGLILLALGLIVAASAPLRGSEVTALVLERLAHDPVLALIVAALLTWLHAFERRLRALRHLAHRRRARRPAAGADAGARRQRRRRARRARPGARRRRSRRGGCSTATSPSARSGRSWSSWRSGRSPRRSARLGDDPGAARRAFPHALQPRARRRLPAADRPGGAAARAALPRARGRRARRRGSTTSTRRCSTIRRWR